MVDVRVGESGQVTRLEAGADRDREFGGVEPVDPGAADRAGEPGLDLGEE